MSRQELIDFIMDQSNKVRLIRHIEGVDFEIVFKPFELVVLEQIEMDPALKVDSLVNSLSEYYYFVLKVKKHGRDLEQFYPMEEDFFMSEISNTLENSCLSEVDKNDCNRPLDFSIVRGFGVKSTEYLLVFKRAQSDFEIIFDNNNLGFHTVSFSFDNSKLKTIPTTCLVK
jgi:hypothetical protein